jgi:hypothetical protein
MAPARATERAPTLNRKVFKELVTVEKSEKSLSHRGNRGIDPLLFDATEREKVLFRVISDQQWTLIEGRAQRLFDHKIWDDPNPDGHFSTQDQRRRAGP